MGEMSVVQIQYVCTLCVCVCTCVLHLSAFTPRGRDHLFAPLPLHRRVTSASTFRSCVFISIWFALFPFSLPSPPAPPVLTPPESEKADSEDRVSLRVRSGLVFWRNTHSVKIFIFLLLICAWEGWTFYWPFLLCTFLRQTPKKVEVHSIHTYVALYKFLPQEKNDLELRSVTPVLLFTWDGGVKRIASASDKIWDCITHGPILDPPKLSSKLLWLS